MKKILLLTLLLLSCSTPEQLVTTSQIVKGDTITIETTKYVSLTRQERLAIKDSLKHEIKKAKVERLVIRDSIKYVYKTKWIEKTRFKDSVTWVVKEKKVDNKHIENVQKQEDKHEKKMAKKSNWWVWMLVGSIVTLIIIFIFRR